MNIVTVIGSPHGMKGNTGRLLASVEASLKASGADVTQFDVTRMERQALSRLRLVPQDGPVRDQG